MSEDQIQRILSGLSKVEDRLTLVESSMKGSFGEDGVVRRLKAVEMEISEIKSEVKHISKTGSLILVVTPVVFTLVSGIVWLVNNMK